jgi:hypothetical protein
MYLEKIEPHAQDMTTTLNSIVDTYDGEDSYDHSMSTRIRCENELRQL